MALPNINDLTTRLVATCDAMLGDTIRYKIAGGPFANVTAMVEYGRQIRDIGTGQVVDLDHRVSIAKLVMPRRPLGNDRLILPDYPGISFKPVNVDEVGLDWIFEAVRA